MSLRKKHCVGDCDFVSYYAQQAGGGFDEISVYRGRPYQRGHGIGSLFKRFGIPLAKFLGRHLFKAGVEIGADALANESFDKNRIRETLKRNSKEALKEGLNKLSQKLDQSGSGRRKRKVYKKAKKKKKVKRLRKDIFS